MFCYFTSLYSFLLCFYMLTRRVKRKGYFNHLLTGNDVLNHKKQVQWQGPWSLEQDIKSPKDIPLPKTFNHLTIMERNKRVMISNILSSVLCLTLEKEVSAFLVPIPFLIDTTSPIWRRGLFVGTDRETVNFIYHLTSWCGVTHLYEFNLQDIFPPQFQLYVYYNEYFTGKNVTKAYVYTEGSNNFCLHITKYTKCTKDTKDTKDDSKNDTKESSYDIAATKDNEDGHDRLLHINRTSKGFHCRENALTLHTTQTLAKLLSLLMLE